MDLAQSMSLIQQALPDFLIGTKNTIIYCVTSFTLGLTSGQNFFRIVLPQAIPLMIPPFVNDLIYMLKDSAIVSVIAGTELTSRLDFWRSHNGSNPIPLFVLAMALYLALSLPTSYVARWYEQKLRAAL